MMADGVPRWLTVAGVAGTGLMSGFFFAFSTIAMTGLRKLPADQGLAAMQSINKAANSSPALMLGLFGTGAVCVALGADAVADLGEPASTYHLVGSGLYLIGGLGLTLGYHVPKNEALATLDPTGASAADQWRRYASTWTAWNHVRTAAPLPTAISFALALRMSPGS